MMPVVLEEVADAAPDEPAVFCIHCGYDLRGTTAGGNCPECGQLFVPTARLADADPVWLARLQKAGYGMLMLFIFPNLLFQSGATIHTVPLMGAVGAGISSIFAIWHLSAAWILSGNIWVETANDDSHQRRSLLLTFSWLLLLALALIAAGAVLKQPWILATGLVLTLSGPICAWLDMQFIAAIAMRIPDAKLAVRARQSALPVALGLGAALVAYGFQVMVFRVHSVITALTPFALLLPTVIFSGRVTKSFAKRLKELR